ncbi:MAG: TIGR03621 family F420-dependent LLM class oxidoreductase [Chloroflexi bacterium]|nr:TIGR03621 family F420-dependent LLM class oxidoreductase [Chloroflexota bacterium]
MPRPFRFGVNSGAGVTDMRPGDWAENARLLEDLGYDVMLIPDHYSPVLSPLPAAMAAAMATMTLRVGTFVCNQAWRHPAVLAKEAATVDFLSNSRFELGVGAGWVPREQERVGIPFESPGERVSRLAEYIQVTRGLLSQENFSFSGAYFQVDAVTVYPRPVQQPSLPMMVGANAPRLLRLAGRTADIVAVGLLESGPEAWTTLDQKVAWVREAAGARFEQLELNLMTGSPLPIGIDRAAAVRHVLDNQLGRGPLGPRPYASEAELESPTIWLGTPEQVAEMLLGLRERYGISYFAYWPPTDRYREYVTALAPVIRMLKGK